MSKFRAEIKQRLLDNDALIRAAQGHSVGNAYEDALQKAINATKAFLGDRIFPQLDRQEQDDLGVSIDELVAVRSGIIGPIRPKSTLETIVLAGANVPKAVLDRTQEIGENLRKATDTAIRSGPTLVIIIVVIAAIVALSSLRR